MANARRTREVSYRITLAVLLAVAGCAPPLRVLGPLGLGASTQPAATQPAGEPTEYTDAPWQQLLLAHVAPGYTQEPEALPGAALPDPLPSLVDYDAILAEPDELDAYLRILAVTGPARTPSQFPTDAHRLAYWINAYNACAIRAVLANYPTESVYSLDSPRFEEHWRVVVDGRPRNLAQIRQEVIGAAGGDVRALFALCDAAVGSAPLARYPYRPANLFDNLDAQMRECLALPFIQTVSHRQQQLQLWWRIVQQRDLFEAYYTRLYGAPPASLLNVMMDLSAPPQRRMLSGTVGYRVVEIPFDRTLNRLAMRASGAGRP